MIEQVSNGHKRIAVVSGDILPLPGLPTTGAGLRAWGLGKGLEARGHDVHFLMPDLSLGKFVSEVNKEELRPYLYSHTQAEEALSRRLIAIQPEIVVLQHWPLALTFQTRPSVPVVIDFHGPAMLESLYQDRTDYQQLIREKLQAIATRGNYFTCAGEKQRYYFYAWLMMAGFDLRHDLIGVVPVCVSPDLPKREPFSDDIHFVYGGVYLPWQDPVLPLHTLLKTLEDKGAGCLDFFGGQHNFLKLPSGSYEQLKARIGQSPRAKDYGMVSHERLIDHYRRAHVAFDLMQRNPEREMAFTTRTVEYLWCGLPVIYNNYGELAGYIKDYDAGWTLDPRDVDEIRAVVETILQNPAILEAKSANARRLACEQLNWEKAVEPLDHFCRQPTAHKPTMFISTEYLHEHEKFMNLAQQSLPLVRRYRRSLPAKLTALAKETGKSLLGQRFFIQNLERPAFALPLLTSGRCYGQRFKADGNYLSSINLLIGTHQRTNTCNLLLHLRAEPEAEQDLRTVAMNAAFLQDNQYCKFSFDAIPNSKNLSFYFFIESPDATISDAVSLFAYSDPLNEHTQRYENGRDVEGELVYTLDYHL
jgi:glycosyltransferase involved in cell wall biosynthesis